MFFIVFVKFFGWIVAMWVRLARSIEEKGGLQFWKGGPITKMKYIMVKKKIGPRRARVPLGPIWVCPWLNIFMVITTKVISITNCRPF